MYSTSGRTKFAALAATIALALVLGACGTESDDGADTGPSDSGNQHHMMDGSSTDTAGWTNERAAATENGTFYVTYTPDPEPIPFNTIFSMDVAVYQSDEMDTLVEDAEISVEAEMPTHEHGMNTEPEISKTEDGKFEVQGMKFHMRGDLQNTWVMTVEVTKGQQTDAAKFDIIVKQ